MMEKVTASSDANELWEEAEGNVTRALLSTALDPQKKIETTRNIPLSENLFIPVKALVVKGDEYSKFRI